ncbi:Ferredoxin--nitrite reductase (EC [Lentimonas sp. CC4]|nr:Ferredoxin--nitrite reductase (EC [Lentimonas sp. CC4]CAA6686993.1 Ferredoxin--nitrite reductase (EC [Lentimonas sp. CC6]CAA7075836.1 Ferredoxin--nitrite reductase (EC [Lentimonas sp. CC4]CAA7172038.1 Ferredoxin--nitrite reductase (EC [Lentimonas sp. CC21]CAA7182899.1 Ferredoxin--nitrite reductase (EC [Lentimonas sp. CC8]
MAVAKCWFNMTATFDSAQKQYLEGFFSGVNQRGGMPFLGQNTDGQFTDNPAESVEYAVYGTPVDELCKEELIKHERNGLDVWDQMFANAEANQFPEADDMFRYKFHGLFHVKPAQDSFMLRTRVAGCALSSHQFAGLADIAEDFGGGYLDLTTRGNTQVREILPKDTIATLTSLDELGLTAKGSGADNLRNVTASPTSGFDPEEVLDVLPYARSMHHYILNNRDLYGLPRKFNISFDNGGRVSVCADTNDIAFYAVRVGEGKGVEPGVYFRVQLCGITGHKQFASDCGILIKPSQAVPLAAAMIRVFIENGDRTNRKKSRLKYLVDNWGQAKFLSETEKKITFELPRIALDQCEPRGATMQHGHIGVYDEKESGFNYIGVVVPVGRMMPRQVRAIAKLADTYGRGDIRLTAWQNLIIPGIKDADVEAVKAAILEMGFHYKATTVSGGLIACTGSAGCKFAASNTKSHAVQLAKYLESEIELDQPINIHLTGCHHSCAQHYIGDIGLIGAKVKIDGESVEGYSVVLGGGVDERQAIAHEVFSGTAFDDLKPLLLNVLKTYQTKRLKQETFFAFSRRHTAEELRELFAVAA